MTPLEEKVIQHVKDNYLQSGFGDLYILCKNIVKRYGDNPTDQQIADEAELFYNN